MNHSAYSSQVNSSGESGENRFQKALLTPDLPPPDGITAWDGVTDTRRFDLYRNNVIVSLIDVLANTFDVVQQLVGKPFFRAMAREFLRDPDRLPKSPVLAHYGADFPSFIADFEPASSLPFLSEVARLEWLRLSALHATDAAPVDSEYLAVQLDRGTSSIPARICFHPSAALYASRYAAVSIWAAHQGLTKLAEVDPRQPEQALIVRPALEVELIPLEQNDAALIGRLMAGEPLQALSGEPGLNSVFELLAHHGAITGLTPVDAQPTAREHQEV